MAPGGGVLRGSVDEHALVRLAPGTDPAILSSLDLVVERTVSTTLHIYRVRSARAEDGLDVALRLAAVTGPGRPLVDAIPDWILAHRSKGISIPPNDPRYSGQWYLDRISIEDAWQLSTGDASTTIVVIDTGCDGMHVDLADHMDQGLDVIDMDTDPTPTPGESGNGHGTSCAGLAAAVTDNGEGIAGTCAECRLRCVRLLGGGSSELPISADVSAFQFVIDTDAAVASNSWGFVSPMPVPDMLRTIIESVVDTGRSGLGALVLFASGNDDRELLDYELEAVRGVITVGATTNFDEATPYSNYGASVDIVAPDRDALHRHHRRRRRGSRRLHDALRRDVVGVPHRRRCGRAPGQRGAGHERRGFWRTRSSTARSPRPTPRRTPWATTSPTATAASSLRPPYAACSASPSPSRTPDRRCRTPGRRCRTPARRIDAGADGGMAVSGGGCGCAVTPASGRGPLLLFAALGLALLRRRSG